MILLPGFDIIYHLIKSRSYKVELQIKCALIAKIKAVLSACISFVHFLCCAPLRACSVRITWKNFDILCLAEGGFKV